MSRRQIAEKVGDMFADWFRKDKEAQAEAVTRLNLPANNTAQDRAKAMGFDIDNVLYHGSLKDFDEFSLENAVPESYFGKGIYLTDNADDASFNYATPTGADITNRMERASDMDESLDASELMDKWKEHNGAVTPVVINKGNQAHISDDGAEKTWLDLAEEYDEDAGDYIENANNTKLFESINDSGYKYNFEGSDLWQELEMYGDDISADELYKRMDKADFYAEDDLGNIVNNQVINDTFQDLGYDSVTMNAQSEFPLMMREFDDTTHTVMFKPEKIRSPLAHFNPKYAGIGAGSILSGNLMADELDLEYKGLLDE